MYKPLQLLDVRVHLWYILAQDKVSSEQAWSGRKHHLVMLARSSTEDNAALS